MLKVVSKEDVKVVRNFGNLHKFEGKLWKNLLYCPVKNARI